jgi:hypothetical protein
VTQSDAEKRAYLRGYNRGVKRENNHVRKITDIAKGWRLKAQEGFGGKRCDTCAYWRRGEGQRILWGECGQDWESAGGGLGTAWPDWDSGRGASRILISHENFACINWQPKKPLT